MIGVQQQLVDQICYLYRPGFRYLESAKISYPSAEGVFKIKTTEYFDHPSHMTDIEAQLCLNQLCYVFVGHELQQGRWAFYTFEKLMALQRGNSVIVESKKRFRRETPPGKTFLGTLTLTDLIKTKANYLGKFSFNLNNGACTGSLTLALKLI